MWQLTAQVCRLIKQIAKVAFRISETSPEDGLKMLSAAIVKKEELKDREDIIENIKDISKSLKEYAFYKKVIGNQEESTELFKASDVLENSISAIYLE